MNVAELIFIHLEDDVYDNQGTHKVIKVTQHAAKSSYESTELMVEIYSESLV